MALSESSASLSDETLDRIEDLVLRIEAAADLDEFLRLDREFHLLSYTGADMPQLTRMIDKFWNSTQHYRRAFASTIGPAGFAAVHSEHRLIVDALRRRDAEQAGIILYGHIRRTRLALQTRPEIFA